MSTLRNRTKFGPQRSGMTHAAWRLAQAVWRKSGARWFHQGGTYNVGRNKAKRMRRIERARIGRHHCAGETLPRVLRLALA